ncbi:hypothetical protein KKF38_03185, partial [Patescibacteria group bacterium]|nr:hypothetical protein [Patescibacteria group bacterium]
MLCNFTHLYLCWMLESGEWRFANHLSKPACRQAGLPKPIGGWRVEGGGWRVEGGGWRVEGGGWRVEG